MLYLVERHTEKIGCRTLDVMHVASAMEFGANRFISGDQRQIKLARAAGLKVVPVV